MGLTDCRVLQALQMPQTRPNSAPLWGYSSDAPDQAYQHCADSISAQERSTDPNFDRHHSAGVLASTSGAPPPSTGGVRQRRDGSWRASLMDPVSQQKLKLGDFGSAAEVRPLFA